METTKIEYRVRPVTRYIVTRYEEDNAGGQANSQMGEYDNQQVAYEVGYALCKAEHSRLGWNPGDTRIVYPAEMTPSVPFAITPDGKVHQL